MTDRPELALQGDGALILEALAAGAWLEIPTVRKTWTSYQRAVGRAGVIVRSKQDPGHDTASELGVKTLIEHDWITPSHKAPGYIKYTITDAGRARLAQYLAHPQVKAARLRHWQRRMDWHNERPEQYPHPGASPEP